jgi:TRAP-type C4-dicarboxylate transport system permease small subunit
MQDMDSPTVPDGLGKESGVSAKNPITRVIDFLHATVETVSVILLFIMIVVTVYQVVMRGVFRSPTSWSEEVALLLMIWFGYLGMVLGIRENVHISVEFFFDLLPEWMQFILDIVNNVLLAVFSYFMLVEGMRLMQVSRAQRFPATRLNRSWMYAVMLVAGALMILYILEKLAHVIGAKILVSRREISDE